MATASRRYARKERRKAASGPAGWLARGLFESVDAAVLAYFRVVFGGVVLWHYGQRLAGDWILERYVNPSFHFPWIGLEWIVPWPGPLMAAHFAGIALVALCVLLGFVYRLAATLLFVSLLYTFLLDQAYYDDFDYLICLLGGIMIVLPAQRAWSLDGVIWGQETGGSAPRWTLWLLRGQIAVPYLFGGLAKLNADWLSGEPVRMRLADAGPLPVFSPAPGNELLIDVVSYGSLIFGLAVVPLLLFPRTRFWAFTAAVLLNAGYTFESGTYACFMILATLVFFSPDWPRRLFPGGPGGRAAATSSETESSKPAAWTPRRRRTAALLAAYAIVQMLVPLRHVVYPSDPSWTNEGHRFAWRSLVRSVKASVRFDASEPRRGFSQRYDPKLLEQSQLLNETQFLAMARDPDLILVFAHFLRDLLRQNGLAAVEIRAAAVAALNGREPQYLVDPDVNLAEQPRRWLKPYWWITPLGEPLHRFREDY